MTYSKPNVSNNTPSCQFNIMCPMLPLPQINKHFNQYFTSFSFTDCRRLQPTLYITEWRHIFSTAHTDRRNFTQETSPLKFYFS